MNRKIQSQADLKKLFPELLELASAVPIVNDGSRKIDFRKALAQMDSELCALIDGNCTDQEYFNAYLELHAERYGTHVEWESIP